MYLRSLKARKTSNRQTTQTRQTKHRRRQRNAAALTHRLVGSLGFGADPGGRAKLTLILRPRNGAPFSPDMAEAASSGSANCTNPKPAEAESECLPRPNLTRSTEPNLVNNCSSSSSAISGARLPTYTLVPRPFPGACLCADMPDDAGETKGPRSELSSSCSCTPSVGLHDA